MKTILIVSALLAGPVLTAQEQVQPEEAAQTDSVVTEVEERGCWQKIENEAVKQWQATKTFVKYGPDPEEKPGLAKLHIQSVHAANSIENTIYLQSKAIDRSFRPGGTAHKSWKSVSRSAESFWASVKEEAKK